MPRRPARRWLYRHGSLHALAINTHAAAGVGGVLGSSAAVGLGIRWGAGRVIIGARGLTALAWGLVALASLSRPSGPLAWASLREPEESSEKWQDRESS